MWFIVRKKKILYSCEAGRKITKKNFGKHTQRCTHDSTDLLPVVQLHNGQLRSELRLYTCSIFMHHIPASASHGLMGTQGTAKSKRPFSEKSSHHAACTVYPNKGVSRNKRSDTVYRPADSSLKESHTAWETIQSAGISLAWLGWRRIPMTDFCVKKKQKKKQKQLQPIQTFVIFPSRWPLWCHSPSNSPSRSLVLSLRYQRLSEMIEEVSAVYQVSEILSHRTYLIFLSDPMPPPISLPYTWSQRRKN